MGLNIKGAEAPVSNTYTKFRAFTGMLILVVPHKLNIKSQFQKELDDGTKVDQFQHFATVIPLEDGMFRDDNGKKTEFVAGEPYKVFIGAAKVMRQITEVDQPILGRLVKGKPVAKGGRPWELATPDDDELKMVDEVDGLEETVDNAIAEYNEREAQYAKRSEAKDDTEDDESSKVPF